MARTRLLCYAAKFQVSASLFLAGRSAAFVCSLHFRRSASTLLACDWLRVALWSLHTRRAGANERVACTLCRRCCSVRTIHVLALETARSGHEEQRVLTATCRRHQQQQPSGLVYLALSIVLRCQRSIAARIWT
jgi:hypothetical protein